jgi:DNA segregation ATPase FtsK/SpoIIIE, S-DNA-T family
MSKTTQTYTRNTSPPAPLPSRMVRLLSEARWFALTVITAYLILIFLTYSKADPGWSHANLTPS